jgi:imidazolonepropionase-like amidohydrolase
MRSLTVLLPLLTVAVVPAPAQSVVALVHGRIVDGTGAPPIDDGVILISLDRITAVGPATGVRIPEGARVVDVRGRTILPGLVDLHTHLTGGWDGVTVDLLGYRHFLKAFLYAGVTTTFDLANSLPFTTQLRQEVAAGRLPGPRIYTVGSLIDGPTPAWAAISYALSSNGQIPGILKQLEASGVDAVKVYGGLTDDQVRLVAEAAARDSLMVIADVWNRNGSPGSARTGIRAFAHASASPLTDEAIRVMRERSVATITTLAVQESGTKRRFRDRRLFDEPLIAHSLPPWYHEGMTRHAERIASRSDSARLARLEVAKRNVKRMFDAGILLVAGTDAPYPGDYYGEGLHRELELLVEAGLSPLQAITVATGNAAKLIGPKASWGVLAQGKVADLIVVAGDPLTRIADTRRLEMVWQGGKELDRASLRFDPRRDGDHRPSTPLQ